MKKNLLITLILFFTLQPLSASEVISITEPEGKIVLGIHTEYFEDKDDKLELNDIQKMETGWKKSEQKNLNFGVTASRLEGLTKTYSTAILISEDVLKEVEDKSKYEYRYLDTVKVKGKNKAVRILEILNGVSSRIRELKIQTKKDFENGILFYTD